MINYFSQLIKPRSIAGKLTLIYGLSVFAILLITSFILYMALIQSINKQNTQYLQDEIAIIRGILKVQPSNIAFLEEEIPWDPKSLSVEKNHYFTRIIDANGRVLIETPGMSQLLPMHNIPVPIMNVTSSPQTFKMHSTLGNPFLLMTV